MMGHVYGTLCGGHMKRYLFYLIFSV
uniref:Uncharacterized protein n=1 Tax=Rhizophora mucronata TaxID=61149 RepID=A0A2P2QIK4_RHIMU